MTVFVCGGGGVVAVYVDMGRVPSDTATISFNFNSAASTSRQWEIKVTQLECGSMVPPKGCLQYFMGTQGRFTTFNFLATADNHLASQQ